MKKLVIGTVGGFVVADIVSNSQTQYKAHKKKKTEVEAQTEMINAEINYSNKVVEKLEMIKEQEKEIEKKAVDDSFEKMLRNEININDIKEPELKRLIKSYLDGNRGVEKEVEIKEKLQKYISQTGDFSNKAHTDLELLIMKEIVSRVAEGKDKVEAKHENGKVIIVIPETIVRKGIEEFSRKQQQKQGFVAYGGRHRREMIEFISEYAELKISKEVKLKDVELRLKAEIVRDVLNKMLSDSYRSGEENSRDNRYRDPRKASSLLEDNNITEKTIEQDVRTRFDIKDIGRVDKYDVRNLAEIIYENVKERDSLTDEQQKELMEAIEGKLEEKVEELKLQKKIADLTENTYIQEEQQELDIKISKEKRQEIEDAIKGLIKENTEESKKMFKDRLNIILSDSEVERVMVSSKDLVRLISGRTEVEIPEELYDLAESATRLQEARRELREVSPNSKYKETDIEGIIGRIKNTK